MNSCLSENRPCSKWATCTARAVFPTPGIPSIAWIATRPPARTAPVTAAVMRSSSPSRPVNAAVSGGSEYRTASAARPRDGSQGVEHLKLKIGVGGECLDDQPGIAQPLPEPFHRRRIGISETRAADPRPLQQEHQPRPPRGTGRLELQFRVGRRAAWHQRPVTEPDHRHIDLAADARAPGSNPPACRPARRNTAYRPAPSRPAPPRPERPAQTTGPAETQPYRRYGSRILGSSPSHPTPPTRAETPIPAPLQATQCHMRHSSAAGLRSDLPVAVSDGRLDLGPPR